MTQEQKKAVTIIDKSIKALDAATAQFTKLTAEVDNLEKLANDLAYKIEEDSFIKQTQEQENKEALRRAKADLELKILENEEAALDKLMSQRGLFRVTKDDYNSLVTRLDYAEQENVSKIDAAKANGYADAERKAQQTITELTSEHKVEMAELVAENKSLESKLMSSQSMVSSLEMMLNEERMARVQIASTTTQPIINVGQGK